MKLLSVSLADAYFILLSASLLAGVGATPLPLALGSNTAAVSRAAVDPSHLVVTSGRGLPENINPGLTSRSSDFLTARDSTIPLSRRADYNRLPALTTGKLKGPRPSLKALGNPIQELLTRELDDKRYNVKDPGDTLRMLRLDLLFALAEETDFVIEASTFLNPSLDAKLKNQIEDGLVAFSKDAALTNNLAQECLIRLRYLEAVLDRKSYVVKKPSPPQLPGSVDVGDNRYTTFLQNKIKTLEGDGETQDIKLILKRRIKRLGLRYNLIREIDPNDWRKHDPEIEEFKVDLKYFEALKEDAGSEAEMIRECKARAKYYKNLLS
ncbi:hypothetical protein H0H93_010105 [Arthromyces matolae]|nr:hypothetical protein H0H93_010105 [Arthromyces matolae]